MSKATIEDKLKDLGPAELAETRRLVAEIARLRRVQARIDGRVAARVARLAEIAQGQGEAMGSSHGPEYARRAMAAEVAAATRVHPSSARAELEAAECLVTGFPVTHRALVEGRITARHARAVTDAGLPLDTGARASLDAVAVSFAEARTPGQFAKIVKLQAARAAAVGPEERHEAAREQRGVFITDLDDGMSELALRLPTLHAHAIHDRLTRMATQIDRERRAARRAWVAAGNARPEAGWYRLLDEATPAMLAAASRVTASETDPNVFPGDRLFPGTGTDLGIRASDTRTFDQLRADLAADLTLTGGPAGHELATAGGCESGAGGAGGAAALTGTLAAVTGHVQVLIPAHTILNPSEGLILGPRHTVIAADDALAVAGRASGWDRLFADAETGELLAVDRYRPSKAQRRMIIARDGTCRAPGCTVPARRCDIDHVHDYALGGPTDIGNLQALCQRHHMMKHTSAWQVRALGGGLLEWTSPTGQEYPSVPESRVFFRELLTHDDAPAPFATPDTERTPFETRKADAAARAWAAASGVGPSDAAWVSRADAVARADARGLAANYREHRADQAAREHAIEAASDAIGTDVTSERVDDLIPAAPLEATVLAGATVAAVDWSITELDDTTLPAAPTEASAIERLAAARLEQEIAQLARQARALGPADFIAALT